MKQSEELVVTFDFIESVHSFMRTAGQSVHRFDAKQAGLYIGLQLEELAEKLEAVQEGTVTKPSRIHFNPLITMLRMMSAEFKQGLHESNVLRAPRTDLLDADIDLAWVSIAGALSTCTNIWDAAREVARANHDKFPDGVVTRDASGKVKKPPGWRAPNLDRFVKSSAD